MLPFSAQAAAICSGVASLSAFRRSESADEADEGIVASVEVEYVGCAGARVPVGQVVGCTRMMCVIISKDVTNWDCVGNGQFSAELFSDTMGVMDGYEVISDGEMVKFSDGVGVTTDAAIWLLPVEKKLVELASAERAGVDRVVDSDV